MRKLIKNVITQEEGDLLSKQVPLNYRALLKDGVPNPIIHKVLTVLLREAGLTSEDLHAKSYVNVERRSRGHRWHKDIGQAAPDGHAHMDWCRIGASMVLTDLLGAIFSTRIHLQQLDQSLWRSGRSLIY